MKPAQFHERTPVASSPRVFGFVFTIFFFIVATLPFVKGERIHIWALVVTAVIFSFASFAPRFLSFPNKVWLKFGLLLHRITQPLMMGLIFYCVFTPIGMLMRIFKGDLLRRKWDTNAKSYWVSRSSPSPESMKHLF